MSETKALKNALIKLAIVCVFAVLYSLGGYDWLWMRRFAAPGILCAGMFYFSRNWRCLVQLPLMMFSLAIGYGGEEVWTKIFKRALFGVANGTSSSLTNILTKKWILTGTQIILVTGTSVVFGVWNPFPSARVEELIIGLFIGAIPIFSIEENN